MLLGLVAGADVGAAELLACLRTTRGELGGWADDGPGSLGSFDAFLLSPFLFMPISIEHGQNLASAPSSPLGPFSPRGPGFPNMI